MAVHSLQTIYQAHLHHAHNQPGGHSVAGRVSDRHTDAAAGHLYEIIVIASNLCRRAHPADDLQVIQRNIASRQHRQLKLAR